jgi:hypothetical protein
MKAKLSIECDVITEYEKAKIAEEQGKIVWTIIDKNNNEHVERKLIKTDAIGFIVMFETPNDMVLYRGERWIIK